jgi:hypothetical protein
MLGVQRLGNSHARKLAVVDDENFVRHSSRFPGPWCR